MTIRRGLVLGCGGTVGGAWTAGALAAVAENLDWDPRDAAVIVGTSSGSAIAALLGAGVPITELVAAHRDEPAARPVLRRFCTEPPAAHPPWPRPGLTSPALVGYGLRHRAPLALAAGLAPVGGGVPSFLDPLARELAPAGGWVAHPATWLLGVDLGTARRVAFGRSDAPVVPLRHALHASWAIPGWYRPMRAHGHRYADGGVRSPASADLVTGLGLDEVVLVAPMVSVTPPQPRGLRRAEVALLRTAMSHLVEAEVAALRAGGVRVLRVHPGAAELAAMGPNFMAPGRRRAALDAALTHVPTTLEEQSWAIRTST